MPQTKLTDDQQAHFDELITPKDESTAYIPIPTTASEQPKGSLFMASVRNLSDFGAVMNTVSGDVLSGEVSKDFEWLDWVPDDLLTEYGDRYAFTNTQEQADSITRKIRTEQNDNELMSRSPVSTFALGMGLGLVSPSNILIPGSVLYSNTAKTLNLAKKMGGVAAATAVSTGVQEGLLQSNQITRTAQESAINVVASSIVGGLLGGVAGHIGSVRSERLEARTAEIKESQRIKTNSEEELTAVLTGGHKELSESGILKAQDLDNMPEAFQKTMKLTPMNRLLSSKFSVAKYFANITYEKSMRTVENVAGETQGVPVERLIQSRFREFSSNMLKYQDFFLDMNGIQSGPFKGLRAKAAGVVSYEDFNKGVHNYIVSGAEPIHPKIKEAGDFLSKNVFDPIRDEMINQNLLPEGVTPKNANRYIMIAFNKQKIIEQGGSSARGDGTFPQALYDGFKEIQSQTKAFKESPVYKNLNSKLNTAKGKLKATKKTSKATKKKLSQEITELENKLKEQTPWEIKDSKGNIRPDVSDDVLWSHVEQTVDNILGHKEGQLLNPILQNLQGFKTKTTNERAIKIPQIKLSEWHITDASRLAEMYMRATVPHIEMNNLARRFGVEDASGLNERIGSLLKEEYDELSKGLSGKEAANLKKQLDSATKDMSATLEMLKGVYGSGFNVMSSKGVQYFRNFLTWNATRLLGYMTLSSFPDVGIHVLRNGAYRFVHDGIMPMAGTVGKINRRDLRAIGYACETELATRLRAFSGHEGLTTEEGVFTKSFDAMVKGYGNATMINQWNNLNQRMAGTIAINRVLDVVHRTAKGEKVSQKDLQRVAQMGLKKEHFDSIFKFTENNIDEKTGTYFADWSNWEITNGKEAAALRDFKAVVGQEIDSIVIVPSLGDKPLISHTNTGRALLQFKSFLMASTNKVTYAGLQDKGQIETYVGVMSMLGLGALSYLATSNLKGKEPDVSFGKMAHESIDRSGILGIMMEGFNIFDKAFLSEGVSRYQSRDIVGALTGPTGGAISEITQLINKVKTSSLGGDPLTTKDVEKTMRLMPYQNLFWLDQVTKKIIKNASVDLGATRIPEQ